MKELLGSVHPFQAVIIGSLLGSVFIFYPDYQTKAMAVMASNLILIPTQFALGLKHNYDMRPAGAVVHALVGSAAFCTIGLLSN